MGLESSKAASIYLSNAFYLGYISTPMAAETHQIAAPQRWPQHSGIFTPLWQLYGKTMIGRCFLRSPKFSKSFGWSKKTENSYSYFKEGVDMVERVDVIGYLYIIE